MKIAVLPGDGIGPEIIAESVRVLQVLDEPFELEFADVGGAAFEAHGHPLPEATLKLALQTWAALIGARSGRLTVLSRSGLNARRADQLAKWLSTDRGFIWYAGLSKQKRGSTCQPSKELQLGVRRLWGYAAGASGGIVVGGDAQRPGAAAVWLLLASMLEGAGSDPPEGSLSPLQAEAAYDAQRALDGILADFLKSGEAEAGWLAIRRGEQLIVEASHNASRLHGAALDIQTSALLQQMDSRRESALKGLAPTGAPGRTRSKLPAESRRLLVGVRLRRLPPTTPPRRPPPEHVFPVSRPAGGSNEGGSAIVTLLNPPGRAPAARRPATDRNGFATGHG